MTEKPKKPPVKLTDKQREALDKGRKSFKSGDKWSEEQHAKGVAASVQKRQDEAQKRTFAALLAEALAITTQDGKTRKHGIAEGLTKALEKELAKKNPNGKTVNALYTAIRDTIGEAPTQKIDLNATGNITIGNWRDKLPTSAAAEDAAATPAEGENERGEEISTEATQTDAGTTETKAEENEQTEPAQSE